MMITNLSDLTNIKGIKDTRAERLQNKLGIKTIEDLTMANVDDAYEALREEGDSVGYSQVEAWIAEAKGLVVKSEDGLEQSAKTINPTIDESRQPKLKSEWETIDQFFVDFQVNREAKDANNSRTKIHHMNNGGDEAVWPGLEGHLAGEWMLSHLDPDLYETVLSESQTTTVSATSARKEIKQSAPTTLAHQAIDIAKVAFYQPSYDRDPVQYSPSQKALWQPTLGSEPTNIEVHFALTEQLDQQVDYWAQFYLHNKLTGEQKHLGDSEKAGLVLAEETHTATLSNVNLAPGVYSLQTVVRVNNKPPTIGFLEIPLLQVV